MNPQAQGGNQGEQTREGDQEPAKPLDHSEPASRPPLPEAWQKKS
jgi:hypothetical protein